MSLRRFASFLSASPLLALLAIPAQAQFADTGLVAHYPFEGNVVDATTNDYNGTALGAPVYSTGVIGRSLLLDGADDAVEFRGIPAATFSGDFTITWFMRLPELRDYALIDKRETCSTGNFLEIRQGAPNAEDVAFQLSGAFASATATNRVEADRWVHVAAVRDRNVARVYVEGRAAADVTLPTLSLGTITAPLGIGTSPCIGRGLLRPAGRIDELRVYSRALTATEIVKLSKRPGFTVAPGAASVGATISATATQLVVGRTYSLYLSGPRGDNLLLTRDALAPTQTFNAIVPIVSTGEYTVELRSLTGRATEVRDAPFTVVPRLAMVVDTAAPQAGKPIVVDVSNLTPGALRLVYGDRIVAGPVGVVDGTSRLKFVAPVDYPTSFPASVVLRAELLDGKVVARTTTRTLTVAAPYTGPFIRTSAIVTTDSAPRPGAKFQLGSTLTLEDGTTPADLEVSAFWIGNDGNTFPLPTSALALEPDGDFRLDTYPPSLGAMTAYRPTGPGRIRLVGRRFNRDTNLAENITTDGPQITTNFDTDPQTDITVIVRARTGANTFQLLQGAYVIVDGPAPIQDTLPIPPPPGSTDSGYRTSGLALVNNRQPQRRIERTQNALNQVSNVAGVQPVPPECGTNLRRRYTDANGEAEFLILGGPEPTGSLELGTVEYQQTGCNAGGACDSAVVTQHYTFYITVYTLHLGAGERAAGQTDQERPSRYEVKYERALERFTIRNLKTGEVSVQNVSANILVDVPAIAQLGSHVTIGDPAMFQQVGTQVSFVPRNGTNAFGKFVDFTNTSVSGFLNGAPERVIRFPHRPDAAGSIVSAKLYTTNINTGQAVFYADFRKISDVAGCNVQDDPNAGGTETWELRIAEPLSTAWRYPGGIFFRNDATTLRNCGYIEARNALGGSGRRPICFEWQKPPEYFRDLGGNLAVNDADINNVLVEKSGDSIASATTNAPAAPPLFGSDVEVPEAVTNRSRSSRSTFDVLTSTGSAGATRNFSGDNPDQYNRSAAGASSAGDFAAGATRLEIGSDEFETVLDVTIPLFRWYWGVPEILSAEIYANLRLLAQYYFHGFLEKRNGKEYLDLTTDALFGVFVWIGVDIDVLFGFLVDAGAGIIGGFTSELPAVIEDNEARSPGPCYSVNMLFFGYVDPCPVCPTPVIEFSDTILSHQDPPNCSLWDGRPGGTDFGAMKTSVAKTDFGAPEARALRRHPALAYSVDGAGHALMLDTTGRMTATALTPRGVGSTFTLSTAPGARQGKIVYYDSGKAVAVWAENALSAVTYTASDYPTIARNQRLAYATFDGETWSTRRILTPGGSGEAHLALAACHADDSDCPAGGEVVAVWQRNESGVATAPQHRLKYARYTPGSGWSAVADVATATNVQDITPAVAYVNGNPAIVWSRQASTDLNDFTQRRLAYRIVGRNSATTISTLPAGAVTPAIAPVDGGNNFRIAYMRTLAGEGPIGTQLALHVATASCAVTPCTFAGAAARDEAGRYIYGERPQLVPFANHTTLVLRGFRFGDETGSPVRLGDAIGTVLSSGDLLAVQVDYVTGAARVAPISSDGAMHFGHAAALNPATDSIVTASTTNVPTGFVPLRAVLKATGLAGVTPVAKTIATVGGVEIRAMAGAPDFVVDAVTTNVATVAPNTSVTATVAFANRGTGYVAARDGAARLELRWDLEAATPMASAPIADLAAGAARTQQLTFTIPSGEFGDEQHVLYAVVVPDQDLVELSGDNNVGRREFAGLPVPLELGSSTTPGIPTVQLGWLPSADPRVAGYRVYRLEGGTWLPLGSSPTHGFLDLSANFNVPRTYAVSTYSARGVESARSEAITVMPTLVLPNDVFRDGFEDVQ